MPYISSQSLQHRNRQTVIGTEVPVDCIIESRYIHLFITVPIGPGPTSTQTPVYTRLKTAQISTHLQLHQPEPKQERLYNSAMHVHGIDAKVIGLYTEACNCCCCARHLLLTTRLRYTMAEPLLHSDARVPLVHKFVDRAELLGSLPRVSVY